MVRIWISCANTAERVYVLSVKCMIQYVSLRLKCGRFSNYIAIHLNTQTIWQNIKTNRNSCYSGMHWASYLYFVRIKTFNALLHVCL